MSDVRPEELATADLIVDRRYLSGPTIGTEAISTLLGGKNAGGFRIQGSVVRHAVRLAVLYTSGGEVDWPDSLDPASGDFVYYGDNRTPGHELHDTPKKGNLFLRQVFEDSRSGPESRAHVPPIFLFEKDGPGWSVRFRGLLVPGATQLGADEELVAVWRTTQDHRFQNYRAHFTVLNVPVVTRAWIEDVRAGTPMTANAPDPWRRWVRSRLYDPLKAPRTTRVRSRGDQEPEARDAWITETVHQHFASDPVAFEHLAAELWARFDAHVRGTEVTRASRDGGRDALGEYVIGPATDPVILRFALEAKCYAPGHGLGVKEVARLISRIKHREFGVLVTTSHVGRQPYAEVRDDDHPIIFMTGRDVAETLKSMGLTSPALLTAYLEERHPVEVPAVDLVVPEDEVLVEPAEAGDASLRGASAAGRQALPPSARTMSR